MPETQNASIGYNGEFWFHDGGALYEAHHVKSFTLPDDTMERVDATHLKSPGRRRQFVDGLYENSEIQVVLNFRPLSDTDTKLRAWKASSASRAVMMVIPENGIPVAQSEFTARMTGYDRGEVTADGLMEVTITLEVTSDEEFAAYVEPA